MIEKWNEYWFRSAPLFNLAVCRIIIVGYQLYVLSNGFASYIEPASLPPFLYDPLPALKLFLWPFGEGVRPSAGLLIAVYWTTLCAGVTAVIGLITKASLWIFALGNIFLQAHVYSYGDYHHPEALMMIALLILAMSPAGGELSVDDFWKKRQFNSLGLRDYLGSLGEKTSEFARWPLLLISILFGLIYLDSGLSKIAESGLDWMNGYTLQYYMAQDALRWGSDLGRWLSNQHTLLEAFSWGTMLFELTFFTVVIFPFLSIIYIPIGILMHVGIYLTMSAPFFHFIALYSVFVPWNNLLIEGDIYIFGK